MNISQNNYSKNVTKFLGNVDVAYKLETVERLKDLFIAIYELVDNGDEETTTSRAYYIGNQLLINGKTTLIKCNGYSILSDKYFCVDGIEYDTASLALVGNELYIGGLAQKEKEGTKMTITINNNTAKLLKELQGDKNTFEIAASNDYGIDTETYMTLGIKYLHTRDKHLKQRIIDYLCEINFHSSHEALENNDFYQYLKAY